MYSPLTPPKKARRIVTGGSDNTDIIGVHNFPLVTEVLAFHRNTPVFIGTALGRYHIPQVVRIGLLYRLNRIGGIDG